MPHNNRLPTNTALGTGDYPNLADLTRWPRTKLAILKFKLDRAFTLVVGDQESDVRAGQAAGIRTCLFGGATLSIPVDYRIDDYKQLLSLLKRRMTDVS